MNTADRISLLFSSYHKVTGRILGEKSWTSLKGDELAEVFRTAPFVLASHGTEADPILNYGNEAALKLWEATWEEFTSMPSRLTAERIMRSERAKLLDQVTTNGFIDDYSGIRISTRGRRFRIRQATVWNVLDESKACCGQAVTFSEWEFLN